MKCFVNGVSGQLGYEVVRELKQRGFTDILAVDVNALDITKEKDVLHMIETYKPDVIFHCAAFTAVDKAESMEKEAYEVNVSGTKYLVRAAQKVGAKIIYVSTDYVFDGTKEGLYEIEDTPNPQNIYGKTKLEGENIVREYPKHFIARTSWVFGIHGNNFIKTMLHLSETKKEINVVNDQFGSPTYAIDLARTLVDMSLTEEYGTYHINNSAFCSWAEFATFIFETAGKKVKVNGIPTEEYPTPAKRPLNSRLSKKALTDHGFDLLPTWKNATERYIEELEKENI